MPVYLDFPVAFVLGVFSWFTLLLIPPKSHLYLIKNLYIFGLIEAQFLKESD